MDPEVGDPLGARQDGTRGVARHVVPLAVLKQIVPERRRSLLGPERDSEMRKHCGTSLLYIRHIHQQGGDSVT